MFGKNRRRLTIGVAALLIAALTPGAAQAHEGERLTDSADDLVSVLKSSTRDFRNVEEALAAGYVEASPCIEVPGVGAMGFHYANFPLIDGVTDPTMPEVLVYMPDKDGELELLAVEFISTAATAPVIGGVQFEPGPFPDVFSLHAWVWEDNPAGTFVGFNPAVSCPGGEAPEYP